MKVRNIEVEECIGESSKFRIYHGKTDEKQKVILKVAKTFEDNDVLSTEAGFFKLLEVFAQNIAKFEEKKENNSHYDWLFAKLKTSFFESTQDDRIINVFEAPDIELDELVPLPKICSKTQIDARTSVWILGRFLKFYSFFELMAASGDNPVIRYPIFSPDDYLISPQHHRLVYYNFSGDVSDIMANDYVKSIVDFIIDWVTIDENDPLEKEYLDLLKDFSEYGRTMCEEAHKELYQLVDRLWGIKYHPFTYREKDTMIWKTIQNNKEG